MSELQRQSGEFTKEERNRLLDQFESSGLQFQDFAREHNINVQTMKNWLWYKRRPKGFKIKHYTPVERKKMLEVYLKSGLKADAFCEVWGITTSTLAKWEKRYNEMGADGLMNGAKKKPGDKRKGSHIPLSVRSEIVELKKAEPSFGFKKIKQWLYRNRGVKISANSVGKTIKAEGLPLAIVPKKKRKSSDRIRRFERARPMQLWQSDITQFTLGPASMRIYLTVFMDDHSRYIVSWRLQSRQTADLVIDAFKDACVRFGKPEEVLTDQGRQYFAWRGKSELEKLLEKEGIKHVVSRAHHPQTLGKCERFWETVMNEFWTRVYPKDLEEARVRLGYFIDHYNHQRPHQGIDGAVPADRFFGVAAEVRESIEKTVTENSIRIAIGELPRAPAFLIGQVGDQKISFHGTSGSFYLSQETFKGENQNGKHANVSQFAINRNPAPEIKSGPDEGRVIEIKNELSINPGQGSLGSGNNRAEDDGAKNSASNYGLLDESTDKSRSDQSIKYDTDPILADDESGGSRNDGRTFNSTPETEEGREYGY